MNALETLHSTTQLLAQIALIIVCALLSESVSRKLSLPKVVGYILFGILIGPFALGQIPLGPYFPHGLFPARLNQIGINTGELSVSKDLYNFATIASMVLLFYSGLETDVNLFLRYAFKGSVIGLGGLIFSFAGGYLASALFFAEWPLFHPMHLFMGTIATATSVGITTSVLSAQRRVSSPEGVSILSAAVFDDVLGIVILAIVMGIAGLNSREAAQSGNALATIVLISVRSLGLWLGSTAIGIIFARKFSRGLKKAISSKTRLALFSLSLALFAGAVFEMWGLSMIIGAYIVGLSLSNTDLAYVIQEKLSPILLLFVPIFFIVSGMQINLESLAEPRVLIFGAIYSSACLLGKLSGSGLLSLPMGFNLLGAARIGTGMMPRGEVALIIGNIGLSAGIINHDTYSALMLMVVSSSLIAPFCLQLLLNIPRKGTRYDEEERKERTEINFEHWQLTRFIVSDFLSLIEDEGFFINRTVQPERKIYHIRKDAIFISLHAFNTGKLVFHSEKQSIPFFKTALYEAAANIAESAEAIKQKLNLLNTIDSGPQNPGRQNTNGQLLAQVSSPFLVALSLQGKGKQAVLRELVALLDRGGFLSDAEGFLNDIFEREKTLSTGLQGGLAIPHARSSYCREPRIVIGLKPDGIDFAALDKQPSRIFVMIAVPLEHPHLEILTQISLLLQQEGFSERLLASQKETEVIELLTGQFPATKKGTGQTISG